MASFTRTVRLGAGIAGLGYGVYRLTKGRNDWVTTTFMSTGLSVALHALTGRPVPTASISSIANAVTQGLPAVSQTMARAARSAPDAMVNAGWMP